MDDMLKKNGDLYAKVCELQAKLSQAEADINRYRDGCDREATEVERLRGELSAKQSSMVRRIAELEHELDGWKVHAGSLEASLEARRTLEEQVETLHGLVDSHEAAEKALRAELDTAKAETEKWRQAALQHASEAGSVAGQRDTMTHLAVQLGDALAWIMSRSEDE